MTLDTISQDLEADLTIEEEMKRCLLQLSNIN